jgi:hypothetical protein
MFLELFLNAMIKNIKIQKNLDIIEISKSMEPNKCIQEIFFMKNVHLSVSYDFSKFDGSVKIKCDVPSGTTQG